MNHQQASTERLLQRVSKTRSGEGVEAAIDPATFGLIFGAIKDLIAMCGVGAGMPPQAPATLAATSKNPTAEDDANLWAASKKATKQNITRKRNPTGRKLKAKELKQLRKEHATEAYHASKAEAAEATVEELTQLYAERQAAQR